MLGLVASLAFSAGCYTGTVDTVRRPSDPEGKGPEELYIDFVEKYEKPCEKAADYLERQRGCKAADYEQFVVEGTEQASIFTPDFEEYQGDKSYFDGILNRQRCLIDCSWTAQQVILNPPEDPTIYSAQCNARITASRTGTSIVDIEDTTDQDQYYADRCRTN